jgi:hypothetical protein
MVSHFFILFGCMARSSMHDWILKYALILDRWHVQIDRICWWCRLKGCMHVTHTCRVNLHRPLQLTKHLLFKTCLTHFSLRGERIQSLRYKSLMEEQHNIKVEKLRPKKKTTTSSDDQGNGSLWTEGVRNYTTYKSVASQNRSRG